MGSGGLDINAQKGPELSSSDGNVTTEKICETETDARESQTKTKAIDVKTLKTNRNDAANETENNEAENEARKSLPEPEITEIPIPEAHAEMETVDATALGQSIMYLFTWNTENIKVSESQKVRSFNG